MSAARSAYSVTEESPTYAPPRAPASGIVPRPVIRPEALSFHRLQPRAAGIADLPLLGEAYRCWSDVWKTTLRELDNLPDVPSDEFTRQDEIGALFQDYECIGLTCFRWVDTSQAMFLDDSYFKVWPKAASDAARELGPNVCILSNLTVSPAWRRARGLSVMEVLGCLSVDRFLHSDGDALVGTPRTDRGVNKLCYRLGFRSLARDVVHHGVKIDLVGFYRRVSERLPLSPTVEGIVSSLGAH
jgi:hypothetical protein